MITFIKYFEPYNNKFHKAKLVRYNLSTTWRQLYILKYIYQERRLKINEFELRIYQKELALKQNKVKDIRRKELRAEIKQEINISLRELTKPKVGSSKRVKNLTTLVKLIKKKGENTKIINIRINNIYV